MKITVSGARVQKHFQYEWEKRFDQRFVDSAIVGSDLQLGIETPRRRVIGLIVMDDSGEACALMHSDFKAADILDADALLDAMGDLDRLRQQALGPRDG